MCCACVCECHSVCTRTIYIYGNICEPHAWFGLAGSPICSLDINIFMKDFLSLSDCCLSLTLSLSHTRTHLLSECSFVEILETFSRNPRIIPPKNRRMCVPGMEENVRAGIMRSRCRACVLPVPACRSARVHNFVCV